MWKFVILAVHAFLGFQLLNSIHGVSLMKLITNFDENKKQNDPKYLRKIINLIIFEVS